MSRSRDGEGQRPGHSDPPKQPRRRHRDKYNGLVSHASQHRGHFRSSGVVKRAYDEAEAQRRAASASLRSGLNIVAYPCRVCPAWHIGQARG